MKSEFEEFQKTSPLEPPRGISEGILNKVSRDLNPSPWAVFSRLSLIHFVTGVFTLMACPQFGVHILGHGMGLMEFFNSFGEYGCMVACGSFFLGTSTIVAGLILRPEEIRTIRKNRLLELGGITLLSLGFFIMLDPHIVLEFAFVWAFGSMMTGIAVVEATWTLNKMRNY